MIKSQFSYWSLIWIFCWRKSNKLINKIHERSLRIVIWYKKSHFEDLRKSNNQVPVHQRNLQILMAEVFNLEQLMVLTHQ